MNISNYLKLLKKKGIEIWVEGDDVYFNAPKEIWSEEIRSEVAKCKKEIIKFFKENKYDLKSQRDDLPAVTPLSKQDHYPVSFAQFRLWFLNQLEPDSPFYNIIGSFHPKGDLDIGVLEQALNTLIERHAAFRTSFVSIKGTPYQP